MTIAYNHGIVPYIPGRYGIPSERTGPISAHDTSPSPALRPERLALDRCVLLLYIPPAAVVLRLLLRLLLLVLLQLLRGSDKNRAGDSRLGG